MKPIDRNISKMLRDIKYIRSAIEKNGDNLRRIFYTRSYRIVFWLGGIGIIFLSGIFHYFMQKYGSIEQIPAQHRVILISSSIAFLILIGLIKLGGFRFLWEKYPGESIFSLFIKIIGRSMIKIYFIVGILIIYFSIYFIVTNQAHYIFPIVSIGVGILFSALGNQFTFFELFLCGLMLILPAAISVPFLAQSPESVWLWAGFSFGISFTFLGFFMEFKIQSGNKRSLKKATKGKTGATRNKE